MCQATFQTRYLTADIEANPVNLIQECPIVISIEGLSHAVMMITPTDVEAFVMGFLFTEGIIESSASVTGIELSVVDIPELGEEGIHADVSVLGRALHQFKSARQARQGKSGCGLCGVETLAQAFPSLTPVAATSRTSLSIETLSSVKAQLAKHQIIGNQTGGIHGALTLSPHGEAGFFAEDIGRHNALDKVIGMHLLHNSPLTGCHCVMTSRCSTELVQKAVTAQFSSLIHLASPSSLAVAMAKRYGLGLIHIPKKDAPRHYN